MRKLLLTAATLLLGLLACLPAHGASPHYTVVSWQPGGSYSGNQFRVYKSTDNVNFVLVAITNLPVLVIQDNDVKPNQTYYYYVTAYDTASGKESQRSSPTVQWTVGP